MKSLRDLLKEFLILDEFRLNCVEQVLDTIDGWNDPEKSWGSAPIYYHEKLNYSIRIIFWPAFYDNNPHEHKTWSVTGVFHNELNVNTYTMLENPKRLKKERIITAGVGEVGYLFPGCIHNVSNPSHNNSASIHIFNNVSDINHPEENAIWYPSPRRHNLSKGLVERALITCLSIAEQISSQQAFHLINRIFSQSDPSIKLMAVKSLYRFDREFAKKSFNELEQFI